MNTEITQLPPRPVWKHFHALTQIPRPSGHEQAAIAYIEKFAVDCGLESIRDEAGNLIVRKKATAGRENAKTIILQSHVDMVPQKNSNTIHDFLKDPIETRIDGDWVRANDTTLGADNGIGIAATLAVLESDSIAHGPIEALFTISEETGMDGAFGLKPGLLQGSILLNLDSEEEGELFMGCAGGVDVNVEKAYQEEAVKNRKSYSLSVAGLKGGHSGMDINLGRANANLILLELIHGIKEDMDIRVHAFAGGNLRNAIPREAEAIVTIKEGEDTNFTQAFVKNSQMLKQQFGKVETDMQLSLKETGSVNSQCMRTDQDTILALLRECPNGVIRMSEQMPGIVQTSNNIAIIRWSAGNLEVKMLLRSSSDAEKQQTAEVISHLFESAGARVMLSGAYPGWLPNAASEILQKAKDTYWELFNREAKVQVIHAGLECGIIAGAYPHLDMLSFGPTIKHPHSPDEKVHIASVADFWKFLVGILEAV